MISYRYEVDNHIIILDIYTFRCSVKNYNLRFNLLQWSLFDDNYLFAL